MFSIPTFAKMLELLFRVYGIMLDQDAVQGKEDYILLFARPSLPGIIYDFT